MVVGGVVYFYDISLFLVNLVDLLVSLQVVEVSLDIFCVGLVLKLDFRLFVDFVVQINNLNFGDGEVKGISVSLGVMILKLFLFFMCLVELLEELDVIEVLVFMLKCEIYFCLF